MNRNTLKSISKERHIERDIKHDIARMNLESVNNRRFRETQELRRKMDDKFGTIQEITEMKRKLTKERKRCQNDLSFQRKSVEAQRYRPHINSFFDF
jgi:predicted nuclease with TOPRIM domain